MTAVGVSKSHREIPPHAGSSVWTAMKRVARAAFVVALGPIDRNGRLSSELVDLAGIIARLLPLWVDPLLPPALLLVVLQLETSWQICRPHARGSAAVTPNHQCAGKGVLPCRTAEEAEGRKVLRNGAVEEF